MSRVLRFEVPLQLTADERDVRSSDVQRYVDTAVRQWAKGGDPEDWLHDASDRFRTRVLRDEAPTASQAGGPVRWPRWRCADGRILAIEAMETDHIQRCLRLLRGKGYCSREEALVAWSAPAFCQGEMAVYHAEQTAAEAHPHRAIDAFLRELARRGGKEQP